VIVDEDDGVFVIEFEDPFVSVFDEPSEFIEDESVFVFEGPPPLDEFDVKCL
jgi:hypothetical protein